MLYYGINVYKDLRKIFHYIFKQNNYKITTKKKHKTKIFKSGCRSKREKHNNDINK